MIYLDNDALPRKGTYDALFTTFESMRENKFSVGFREAPDCEPEYHRVEDIPHNFCEYYGGFGFSYGTGASTILDNWLAKIKK